MNMYPYTWIHIHIHEYINIWKGSAQKSVQRRDNTNEILLQFENKVADNTTGSTGEHTHLYANLV